MTREEMQKLWDAGKIKMVGNSWYFTDDPEYLRAVHDAEYDRHLDSRERDRERMGT